MKILHSADWHIRDKDIEEAEKCLRFLCETVAKEGPDLSVIAGDIFDSQDVKLDSPSAKLVIRIISELAELSPIAIITGTATHEGKATEILRYVRGKHPVRVADKPTQIYMLDPDVCLTLIPQPTKQWFQGTDQEVGQAMSAIFAGFGVQAAEYKCPHILVGHWQVSGCKTSTGQTLTGQEIEVSIDQMMLANPDLICLGHIHKAQQMGDRTYYAGSIYRTNWGEMEPKGFYIYDLFQIPDDPHNARFIETPTRKLTRLNMDFTDMPDGLEELDTILYSLDPDEVEGAIIRVDFKVWQDEAGKIDKEAIKRFYMDGDSRALDVAVNIIRVPRETVRAESVLKVERLRDKIKAMAEIKEEQVPESILAKADLLEETPADVLMERMAG